MRAALLALLLLAGACSSGGRPGAGTTTTTSRPAGPTGSAWAQAALAERAYTWGYPLVVSARTRERLGRLVGVNRLYWQDQLSGLTSRLIVAPNQDTLYSVAVLDLRGGPLVLTVPDVTDRYWTYQLLDSWTESFAYLGTRATHGRGGTFVIAPPGWKGALPAGATRLAAPTTQLFLLGRFLVAGAHDIPNVTAIRRRVSLRPLDPSAPAPPALPAPAGTAQDVGAAGIGFFDELGDALSVNPPTTDAQRRLLAQLAPLGIGPGRHPGREVTDPTVRAVLTAAVRDGDRTIAASVARSRRPVNGWVVDLHLGRYGDDLARRAAVAEVGWGANVPAEAVYPRSTTDAAGRPYTGARRYRLHFAAGGLPPVGAFWSLTLYGPDQFFTANPLSRYAIGDRTPGLTRNPDGSLDLFIQHDEPAGHRANWLPAPTGAFSLMLRLYLPGPTVLQGTYRIPAVVAVG